MKIKLVNPRRRYNGEVIVGNLEQLEEYLNKLGSREFFIKYRNTIIGKGFYGDHLCIIWSDKMFLLSDKVYNKLREFFDKYKAFPSMFFDEYREPMFIYERKTSPYIKIIHL